MTLFIHQTHAGPLVISEIMSSNGHSLPDSDDDYEDWIEIWNQGTDQIDLTGFGLSDDTSDPYRWRFPALLLGADEHLVVFASGKDRNPANAGAPDELDGLQLWLDAGAISPEDLEESEPGSPIQRVLRWSDSSTEQHLVSQQVSTKQPLFVLSDNSRSAVRFDGIDDYLESPYSEAFNGKDMTLFVVAEQRGLGGYQAVISSRDVQPNAGPWDRLFGYMLYVTPSQKWNFWAGSGVEWTRLEDPDVIEMNRPHLLTATFNDYHLALRSGGNLIADENSLSRSNEARPLRLGAGINEGAPGFYFNGDIFELVIFNRRLDDTERRQVERYLSNKHQLALEDFPHANFSIKAEGEPLLLTHVDGTLLDEVSPGNLPADVSYGRKQSSSQDWAYFANPTPGRANDTEAASNISPSPVLLPPSGFYSEPLAVTIGTTSETGQVFYSVDGSEPGASSVPYTEPILVTSTTAIRAVVIESDSIPARPVTHTYFINEETSLPVVSLTTTSSNLWDPDNGIFENYNPNFVPEGQRGDSWERPVHVEFFESDRNLGFSANAGVRIHGGLNTTRFPQKSLRLSARGHYGSASFNHRLFDKPIDQFQHILLRNSGNDWPRTLFRDGLMQTIVADLNMDTQAYRPAAVFINGNYWGIYNLRERQDHHYLESNHGIDPNTVDILKKNRIVEAGDPERYKQLLEFVEVNDTNEPDYLNRLSALIEVDSFIDYHVTELFFANLDWPANNIRYWRPRTPDGRWRWMLYDTDFGFGFSTSHRARMLWWATDPDSNNISNPPWATFLLRRLLSNAEFQTAFLNRYADLLNTTFKTDLVLSRIQEIVSVLEPEIPRHAARWAAEPVVVEAPFPDLQSWLDNVEVLKEFASERPAVMRDHAVEFFGLSGTATLTIDTSNKDYGTILVNSIALEGEAAGHDGEESIWTGVYFQGVPIRVRALPKPGYRFVGWTGTGLTNPELTLDMTDDVSLGAMFEPDAHLLGGGAYQLDQWQESNPPGSQPGFMTFYQTEVQDPGLEVEINSIWNLPYDLESRSRINGLGEDGFSFVNTGNPQAVPGAGYLGAAVLRIDTSERENIHVSWTGGTIAPNSRNYAIRLQYRVGTQGEFNDVMDSSGDPVEYLRHDDAGHAAVLGPVRLPAAAENQPLVELRWKYYHVSGSSGPRAQLRVDDILVTSGVPSAHRLAFVEVPATGQAEQPLRLIEVEVQSEAGVRAFGYNGMITIDHVGGTGALNGTISQPANHGVAVFDQLLFNLPGPKRISASAEGLNTAFSEQIEVVGLTEIFTPRNIQGQQPENLDRVPFAYRAQLSGLRPNSVYRFSNRVVTPEDSPTHDGTGNMLVTGPDDNFVRISDSPRFLAEDLNMRHGEFVSDDEGNYSGWFISEPSGNVRFSPGNQLLLRLILNDGADGESLHHFLTVPSPVNVMPFGTGAGEGSALYATSSALDKNFILLFEDSAGESRPLAATIVEATGAEVDSRYAGFYEGAVAGNSGHWGTLLPNGLPAGIRRIEERDRVTGEIVSVFSNPNGLRPTLGMAGGSTSVGIRLPSSADSSFQVWQSWYFTLDELADDSISGPLAKVAEDGLPNLISFALGLNLFEPVQGELPTAYIEELDGERHLIFEHRRLLNTDDVSYVVELSDDLVSWTDTSDELTEVTPPEPNGDGLTETVTLGLPVPGTPSRMFLRLQVGLGDE